MNDSEPQLKIRPEHLADIEASPYPVFGDWVSDTARLHEEFHSAIPYQHVVIPNFLSSAYAELIDACWPTDYENWHHYNNPMEVKHANDDINSFHQPLRDIFYHMSSQATTDLFRAITGIQDLVGDPYLHGAGLHAHPRRGRLHMHLDYEKHPITPSYRRLNVILYMNKKWDDSWGGATELWDPTMTRCVAQSPVRFNHALIFKTDDISWHGLPEPLDCPPNTLRKTIAYYYVSPTLEKKEAYRLKASFVRRPTDAFSDRMEQFYRIRPFRRITRDDICRIWPEWNSEEF